MLQNCLVKYTHHYSLAPQTKTPYPFDIPEQQDDVIPMPSIPYFSHDCHLFEARGIWAPIRFVQHFNEQMQINYKQKGRHNSNKNIDAAAGCRGT